MKKTNQSDIILPSILQPIISNSYKRHKCKHCQLGFRHFFDLRSHLLAGSTEKAICPVCKQIFSSTKGMNQHYGKMHGKNKPSRCSICKKRYRNKYALKLHYSQVHTNLTRVTCSYCLKEYYNKYSLIRHMRACSSNLDEINHKILNT